MKNRSKRWMEYLSLSFCSKAFVSFCLCGFLLTPVMGYSPLFQTRPCKARQDYSYPVRTQKGKCCSSCCCRKIKKDAGKEDNLFSRQSISCCHTLHKTEKRENIINDQKSVTFNRPFIITGFSQNYSAQKQRLAKYPPSRPLYLSLSCLII
jgi:hypothetical protein